jgi:hypothetical protein
MIRTNTELNRAFQSLQGFAEVVITIYYNILIKLNILTNNVAQLKIINYNFVDMKKTLGRTLARLNIQRTMSTERARARFAWVYPQFLNPFFIFSVSPACGGSLAAQHILVVSVEKKCGETESFFEIVLILRILGALFNIIKRHKLRINLPPALTPRFVQSPDFTV